MIGGMAVPTMDEAVPAAGKAGKLLCKEMLPHGAIGEAARKTEIPETSWKSSARRCVVENRVATVGSWPMLPIIDIEKVVCCTPNQCGSPSAHARDAAIRAMPRSPSTLGVAFFFGELAR
jgi:hypothetical protein